MTQAYVTIAMSALGMIVTWSVWVTVSLFKLSAEIGLIKKQFEILVELKLCMSENKEVMNDIRSELRRKKSND